jgi:hypothetical protein
VSLFGRDGPFRMRGDGSVEVTLRDEELGVLVGLPVELREIYAGTDPDEARERLFPRAYLDPTEDNAETEYQALQQPGLLRDRYDALDLVTKSLARGEHRRNRVFVLLSPDEAQVWLKVLNDARLALGVRLKITDDHEYLDVDPESPNAFQFAVYSWLSALQGELIEVLLDDLED